MAADTLLPGNYLPSACPGIVVVHKSHPRIHGVLPVPEEEDVEAEFQWDPQSKVFTVVNATCYPCYTYLTFLGTDVRDRRGRQFEAGTTRSESGEEQPATTFVVVAAPLTAVRLGFVEVGPPADFFGIPLERLVEPGPPASGLPPLLPGPQEVPGFCFPLPASDGPYLCTQGVGGHLTHFFPESYYAIDLRCRNGTPVLSIADGIVKEVAESHKCGGIHAANLAAWNSVTVILDCGFIVDYLHTLPGSARFKAGDVVRQGQVLCESGDIGFAPEPHLHIELHDSNDADGPSLPLSFGHGRCAFVPVAGRWYSPDGEASPPPGTESVGLHEDLQLEPPPQRDFRDSRRSKTGRRTVRFGSFALKRKWTLARQSADCKPSSTRSSGDSAASEHTLQACPAEASGGSP
ncbi:unnamed protein product [Polarella glacialis]|uniref:M23ase beta-sheet core domain-containing protein n=1 Tax=Polarella glacialis TaxID=89957 RepID=A0A813K350_POLGL|nr:unnamed protein product [Polarella glacialis]